MTNPLLSNTPLPAFSAIRAEHILPAVKKTLSECKETIEYVVNQIAPYTWDNLVQPIDEADEKFSRVWSPINHLNSVKNSQELRKAYEASLPIIAEYNTWVGQHKGLYEAYKKLKASKGYDELTKPQKKAIDNALRDFMLSGIGLSEDKQKRYGEIVAELSSLSAKFGNNVLDATMGWTKLITDESLLAGLPESIKIAAKTAAEAKGKIGWLLTLEMPCYIPIVTYCDNRKLRHEVYEAYVTRASDKGPNAGTWDNTQIIEKMLALRHELATLLDFDTFADKSLATKMAENPKQVIDFLIDMAKRVKPQGEKELAKLTAYAADNDSETELQPWDIAYYSEKEKQHLYAISSEELRPYFPQEKVLSGLFEVVHRIFNIEVKERDNVDVWDKQVRFFDIYDKNYQLKGSFYLDLYAREHKCGGAWMDDCITRMRFADGHTQTPVAYLTCNFNKPIGDKPALFTHDEVMTLFHEFGHGLHHMLTEIDISSVAGIHGVPWDAVELPSQFLENWCWQPEALSFISGHYQTGEPLPRALLDKLLLAKNYQAALFILRQLEFGLFDFRLHYDYSGKKTVDILNVLKQVKEQVSVIPSVEWSRLPHAFSHIFSGGYAAGYYSYLWAQVLSADAFLRFEEDGIFNTETGHAFLKHILSQGGSDEPMTLFKSFRGRQPELSALLHHYGIETNLEPA